MRLPLPGGVQRPAILLLLAILTTFVQTALPALLTERNNAGHVMSRIMSADEAFRFLITKYFPFVDNFSASMLDARDIITQKYAEIDTLVHCNGESHSAIQACLKGLQVQVINSLSENKLTEARTALGKALYTVQANATSQDIVSAPDQALRYLEDIKQKIGSSQFRLLFGVGPTLAVIVDTAGSMTEIVQSVLAVAIPIVMGRLETGYEPSTYLIMTFDVAGTGPVTATSDLEIFQSALYDLEASGGTDCTRLAMKGLLDAIELLDEDSDLLIFTDAVPEDVGLAANVIAVALEKHISLQIFRFESRCDDFVSTQNGNSLSKKVYTTVASATSGKLYSLSRPKSAKVGGTVNSLVAMYEELILEIVEDLGTSFDSRVYSVPVDSHVTGLVVSLTGSDLRMRVTGPTGMVLISSFPGAEHVESSEGELWKITGPDVGSWTVRLSGTGAFSLDVTAITHLHFSDAKFPAEKVLARKIDKAPTFARVRRQSRYGNLTIIDATASGAGATNSIACATTVPTSPGTGTSATGTTSCTSSSISLLETVTAASGATFVPTNSTNPTNTLTAPFGSATTSIDPNSFTTSQSISLLNSSITTGTTLQLTSLTNPTSLSTLPGNSTSAVPSTTAGISLANGTSIPGATLVPAGSTNATVILTVLPGKFTGLTSLKTASFASLGNGSTLATTTPSLAASINSTSTAVSSSGNTTSLTDVFSSTTSDKSLFGNASTTITVTLSLAASVNLTSVTASSANSTRLTSTTAITASYLNMSTIAAGIQSPTLSLTSPINSTSATTSSSGNFTGLTGTTSSITGGTQLFGNRTSTTNTVSVSTNSVNATSTAISAGNTTSGSSPTVSLTGSTASFGNETRTTSSNSNSTTLITSFSATGSGANNGTGTANGFSVSTSLTIFSIAPTAPFINGTKAASSLPTGTDSRQPVSNLTLSLLPTLSSYISRASVSGGFSLSNTGRTSLANSTTSHFSALLTTYTHAPITTRSDTILTINLNTSGRSVTIGASSFSSNMQSSVEPPISGSSARTETTELSNSDTYAPNDGAKRPISSASLLFDPANRPILTTPKLIDSIQTAVLTTSYYTPTATRGLPDLADSSEVTITEMYGFCTTISTLHGRTKFLLTQQPTSVYTTTSYCPITVCSSTSGLSSCIVTNSVSTITLTSTVVVPCNKCSAPSHLITLPPVALSSAATYRTPSYNDLSVIEIIYITTSLCPVTATSVISGSTIEKVTDSASTLTLTLTSTKPCGVCGPNHATITLSLVPRPPGSGAVHLSSPTLARTSIASVAPPPQPVTLIGPSGSGIYQCEGLRCGPAGDLETSPAGTGCGGSECESPQIQSTLPEATFSAPGGSGLTENPTGLTEVILTTTSSCESTENLNALTTPTATTPIGIGSAGVPSFLLATILTLQIGSRSAGTPKGVPAATLTESGAGELPGTSYGPSAAVKFTIGENGSVEAPPAIAATITLGENGPAKASHGLPAALTVTVGENESAGTSHGLSSAATAKPTHGGSGPPQAPNGPPTAVAIKPSESGSIEAPHGPLTVIATTLGENGSDRASYGLSAAAAATITTSGGGSLITPHGLPTPVKITLGENESATASNGLPTAVSTIAPGTPHGLPTPVTISPGESESAKGSNGLPAAVSTITPEIIHGPPASLTIMPGENGSAKASYVLLTSTTVKLGEGQSSKYFYSLFAAVTITRDENGSSEDSYGPPTAVTISLGGKGSPEAPPAAAATVSLGENGSFKASHTLLATTRIMPSGSGSAGAPSFASFFTLIMSPTTALAGVPNGPFATLVTPSESGLPEASNTHPAFTLTIPGKTGSARAPNALSASMLTLPIGGELAGSPNSASGLTLIAPLESESSMPPTRTAISTATSTNGYHGPYFTGGTGKTFSFIGQSMGLGLVLIFVTGIVML